MISQEEKKRTDEKLKDPALVSDVCAYVSVGNSLIDLCNIWQVTYWVVSNYLYKHHKDEYEAALCTRGEWIDMRILDEIKSIGLFDIRKLYDENSNLLESDKWPDEISRAVANIEVNEEYDKDGVYIGRTKKIKMWDKLKALELLGKNRKLFVEEPRQASNNILIFQNLTEPAISAVERINLIESALRNQLSKTATS